MKETPITDKLTRLKRADFILSFFKGKAAFTAYQGSKIRIHVAEKEVQDED